MATDTDHSIRKNIKMEFMQIRYYANWIISCWFGNHFCIFRYCFAHERLDRPYGATVLKRPMQICCQRINWNGPDEASMPSNMEPHKQKCKLCVPHKQNGLTAQSIVWLVCVRMYSNSLLPAKGVVNSFSGPTDIL